jgi:hypothetical protein
MTIPYFLVTFQAASHASEMDINGSGGTMDVEQGMRARDAARGMLDRGCWTKDTGQKMLNEGY